MTVSIHTNEAHQKRVRGFLRNVFFCHYFDFKWDMQNICENKILFYLQY